MCLTAAPWDRALLWGTLLISDVSEEQALKHCAFWALQDQSQLPSDTAGACSKAYAHCHGFCKNEALLLVPWPGLNTNWSLRCALGKWSQSQLEENAAGHLAAADVLWPALCKLCSPSPREGAQPLAATRWAAADGKALLCPTAPNKAETKPVLLTNRFICILTGAQILDTDFFCTTVQEPVQNMLFLFIHVQKNPKTNKGKDEECGSIYSQLVRLSLSSTHLHSPLPIMPALWPALPASNSCTVSEER